MKYVSIRIPDAGPFGETFFEASVRAMMGAFFLKSPGAGCVESGVTVATQRFLLLLLSFVPLALFSLFAISCLRQFPSTRPRKQLDTSALVLHSASRRHLALSLGHFGSNGFRILQMVLERGQGL